MGNVHELQIEAITDNLPQVLAFVEEKMEAINCPPDVMVQLDIAVEEIYVNIAHYAYHPGKGPATIRVEVIEDPLSVELTFIDQGVPYDPLAKEDPDITLDLDDREIGGLGIFMVKESMDKVEYEYKDGRNILRIGKTIQV